MQYRSQPSELVDDFEVPEEQHTSGTFSLRYEDLSRDGRISLPCLTHALGRTTWRSLHRHPLGRALRGEKAVPLLARLRIEGGGGPISIFPELEVEGRFRVARTEKEGEPRWRIDMWGDLFGKVGRLNMPDPENAGERIWVGRVLAEHVLTRPFGRPEERKVRALPEDVEVTHISVPFEPPEACCEPPEGAELLDAEPLLDPAPVCFGFGHTDSNQHVNSLMYPRLLEEAALRRFHALGLSTKRYLRSLDIAFRKPSFEGDTLHIKLRAFRSAEGELGVIGAFVETAESPIDARARCFATLLFSE